MAINMFLSTYYAIKLSVCCILLCNNLQCHTVKDLALPNYTTVLFGGGAEQPVFWQIAALSWFSLQITSVLLHVCLQGIGYIFNFSLNPDFFKIKEQRLHTC